ncbi:hypothetical protein MRX96_015883 [Rhipicephalus microplus]
MELRNDWLSCNQTRELIAVLYFLVAAQRAADRELAFLERRCVQALRVVLPVRSSVRECKYTTCLVGWCFSLGPSVIQLSSNLSTRRHWTTGVPAYAQMFSNMSTRLDWSTGVPAYAQLFSDMSTRRDWSTGALAYAQLLSNMCTRLDMSICVPAYDQLFSNMSMLLDWSTGVPAYA